MGATNVHIKQYTLLRFIYHNNSKHYYIEAIEYASSWQQIILNNNTSCAHALHILLHTAFTSARFILKGINCFCIVITKECGEEQNKCKLLVIDCWHKQEISMRLPGGKKDY